MLTLGEALDRLRSPYALEEWSAVSGPALLVVDLDADVGAGAPSAILALRETLGRLPCPSVGLLRGRPSPLARRLESGFDVMVGSEEELAPVREGIERAPLASLALVQLLRHSEHLDVESGLLAESLVYSLLQSGPEFAAWRAARGPVAPPPASAEPAVLLRRDGERLSLLLNRPERHNAFSAEMRDALVEGLRLAESDTSLRRVELRGAGPSFCSGGDLAEFGSLPDPVTAHAVRSTRNAARSMAACAHRTHAHVHGACIGAGVELPAFAGRVSAHPGAWFQLPELEMGLVPGSGGTVSLPRRIGRQRTAWLALSRVRIDAAQAWRWGLVDQLAAAELQ